MKCYLNHVYRTKRGVAIPRDFDFGVPSGEAEHLLDDGTRQKRMFCADGTDAGIVMTSAGWIHTNADHDFDLADEIWPVKGWGLTARPVEEIMLPVIRDA